LVVNTPRILVIAPPYFNLDAVRALLLRFRPAPLHSSMLRALILLQINRSPMSVKFIP